MIRRGSTPPPRRDLVEIRWMPMGPASRQSTGRRLLGGSRVCGRAMSLNALTRSEVAESTDPRAAVLVGNDRTHQRVEQGRERVPLGCREPVQNGVQHRGPGSSDPGGRSPAPRRQSQQTRPPIRALAAGHQTCLDKSIDDTDGTGRSQAEDQPQLVQARAFQELIQGRKCCRARDRLSACLRDRGSSLVGDD